MTIINLYTVDQALYTSTRPKLASGDKDSVQLRVKFDEKWDGYARSAVFHTSDDPTVYEAPMANITTDLLKCTIPNEVLTKAGNLFIGVRGIKSGAVKTSAFVRYKIEKGADGMMVFEPSPDVYQQFLKMYAESSENVANEAKARRAADAEVMSEVAKETTARIAADAKEKADRQAEVAVERARLSQLIKDFEAKVNYVDYAEDENGETLLDVAFSAEVSDIRTDVDGNTHENAGDAVRVQINDVRGGVSKKNLIDFKKLSPGFFNADGGIGLSHQTVNYYRWEYASDFIPVTFGLSYVLSIIYDREVAGWYCLCTYDSNKNFISRPYVQEFSEKAFIRKFAALGEDVAFVRISYRSHMMAQVKFEQSTYFSGIEEETLEGNILDARPLIFDGFIVEAGSIYPPTAEDYGGADHDAFVEKYSRHIPVVAGEQYVLYQLADDYPWCAIGFYGTDGKGIKRIATTDAKKFEFTVPDGAVAMMLSARTYYLKDLALFKKCQQMCGDQKIRENYLDLLEANEKVDNLNWIPGCVNSVAHRGFSSAAPENTLAAYRLAKKMGFNYVECDVSFTSDGYAVLLHDSTIDRTSNGSGSIAGKTLAEVTALDFGSWKSEEYAGERIPQFSEFIALCKNLGLHPYIEVKTGTEAQIKGLFDVVKRYGMKDKVTWISFSSAYLGYIKAVDPYARLGFVVDSVSASTIATIKQSLRTGHNEVFVDCAASNATADAVQLCVADDIPLEVWTVNSESAILALNPYVSGVTSDNLIAGKVFYNDQIGG